MVKNENLVSLAIPILSESLFANGQFARESSSLFAILNKTSFVLWKMNILVSSANKFGTVFLNAFEMLFMYIKNDSGASPDPWGRRTNCEQT